MWGDLVPKLIENSAESIIHQRAAKNIGLQWDYLVSESRHFGTLLRLEYCEIVYKNIIYNGYGEVVNKLSRRRMKFSRRRMKALRRED